MGCPEVNEMTIKKVETTVPAVSITKSR